MKNQTSNGWRYQQVLALCAIAYKDNIEETIFGDLIVYLLCIHCPDWCYCDLCWQTDLCVVKQMRSPEMTLCSWWGYEPMINNIHFYCWKNVFKLKRNSFIDNQKELRCNQCSQSMKIYQETHAFYYDRTKLCTFLAFYVTNRWQTIILQESGENMWTCHKMLCCYHLMTYVKMWDSESNVFSDKFTYFHYFLVK